MLRGRMPGSPSGASSASRRSRPSRFGCTGTSAYSHLAVVLRCRRGGAMAIIVLFGDGARALNGPSGLFLLAQAGEELILTDAPRGLAPAGQVVGQPLQQLVDGRRDPVESPQQHNLPVQVVGLDGARPPPQALPRRATFAGPAADRTHGQPAVPPAPVLLL